MKYNDNVADVLRNFKHALSETENSIEKIESSIGYPELNTIYHTCIRSMYHDLPSNTNPVIEFEHNNDNVFKIVFGFLSDRKPNEYLLVGHLDKFLDIDEMAKLEQDMDLLETCLMANAMKMYETLPASRKQSHSELRKLNAYKDKRYTYSFSGKFYKKKYTMGFMVLLDNKE